MSFDELNVQGQSIFSPEMEAIVFIILQIFFATRAVLKTGEYPRIFTNFFFLARGGGGGGDVDLWPKSHFLDVETAFRHTFPSSD